MASNQSGNDAIVKARAQFDADTRKGLQTNFTKHFGKTHSAFSSDQIAFEARVFIGTLEGYADGISRFQAIAPPEQKRRREKVSSLAGTLEKLHQILTEIDSGALDFAVHLGSQEVKNKGLPGFILPIERSDAFFLSACFNPGLFRNALAVEVTGMPLPTLAAFSRGVRKAIKGLPAHNFKLMLHTALAVERTFWENQISFTVSDNGFAAECLRAVFQLGGLTDCRMDYWLKLARDSGDSMSSLMKRQAAAQKTADK